MEVLARIDGAGTDLGAARFHRRALAALDAACRAANPGKGFAALAPEQQGAVLAGLEKGTVTLKGTSGVGVFELLAWAGPARSCPRS